MTTLSLFSGGNAKIPGPTTWYLADLGEFRGKQELYTHQAPQRLKTLLEHALIESAVSSNRLEGVKVDTKRVRNLLASPKPLFRDQDEEEVRGYRDALRMIHDRRPTWPSRKKPSVPRRKRPGFPVAFSASVSPPGL